MSKNTILKGLLPLAFLPLLFLGCSDDKFGSDSSSGKQISFRLQGNLPSSRTTGTTEDNINAFVVNAQTDWSEDPVLFSSQTVARLEGTANAFDYSPKRYYPDEAKTAEFSAYSPVSKYVDPGFKGRTDDEINTITYFVPAPDINGNTTQEDLLVAYTPVEGVAQTPGAAPVHRDGFESPVQLTFKHALSRVFVRASNKNKEPVVIKDLSLHNLYSKGTLKIDGDTWKVADNGVADINESYKTTISNPATDYKVLWSPEGTQTDIYKYVLLPTGVSVPFGTEGSPVYIVGKDQGMLVLPQTTKNDNNDAIVDPGDFYVEVTYSISNVKEKTVRATFNDLNGKAGGLTFEMGRQYALTLGFDDTDIKFDISVESWEAEEPELAYAATTVVFNENKPAEASDSDDVEHIHDPNSGFIYGQDLLALSDVPVLDGWIFQGYYDSPEPGAKRYYSSTLERQIVFDSNGDGTLDATKWDKAGPSCTLYAHWADAPNVWAASNIYFRPDMADGVVGSLTFAKSDQTKSGYQGLYFKWGSLIGVAAYPTSPYDSTDPHDNDTYLYIPDVSTGKYYKVRAGSVSESYTDTNPEKQTAVQKYAAKISDNSWDNIPYIKDGSDPDQIDGSVGGRDDKRLTTRSTDKGLFKYYKGDICKFLTDTKGTNGSGLTKTWVMPTSNKWDAVDGNYFSGSSTNYKWYPGSLNNTTPDGTDKSTVCLTYTTATGEEVIFPASGYRYDGSGALFDVGGYGYYWSSSVNDASNAYNLDFGSFGVSPAYGGGDRAVGRSVRCVRNE